jgi:hypothetical protein
VHAAVIFESSDLDNRAELLHCARMTQRAGLRSGHLAPGNIGRRLVIEREIWALLGLVAGTRPNTGRGAYIRRAIREQLRRDGLTADTAEALSPPQP